MRRLLAPCILIPGLLSLSPIHGDPVDKQVDITAEELQSVLEKSRVRQDVPALAAGFIRGGGQPSVAVAGVRKRGGEARAAVDDLWHLGSNTKPITAFLIALLIDLGLLDWDTPLEQVFPEHAASWSADLKKITLAHLLTHTSGLPADWPLGWFLLGSKGKPAELRTTVVKNLGTLKQTTKPGAAYRYSNLGYVLLGAIIDVRGKESWEVQLEKRIFQPLGIKSWGLGPAGKRDAVTQPWPHHASGQPVEPNGLMDNPPVMNSAGRIHMSVADYNRFLTETLKLARGGRGLLKPATAKKLFTNPHPVSPHGLSGWLGFRKDPDDNKLILGHDGSNTFNYCIAILAPDRNRALCVLTNQGTLGGPGQKACQQVVKDLLAKKR